MKAHHIKPQSKTRPSLLSLALGLALLGSAGATRAEDLIVNTFDTDISGIAWQNWRSYVLSHELLWDASQDADENSNSGSMYITIDWPTTDNPIYSTSWNDVQVAFNAGTFNVPQTGVDLVVARLLTLNGTNTDLNTINGKIVNNVNASAGASLVALTKSGAGTWVLAGANDYTGGTTVSNGILYVNGSLANGNSNSVASGATLGGTGVIGAVTTLSGRLAPGFGGIGTLTFSNGVTWNGGATAGTATDWLYDLGASNASDLVSITGNFTKGTGAAFRFDLGSATSQGIYTLASWTGSTTFSASDFSYANLGGANTGTFDVVGSSLVLTIVPEPTTTLGLIASGVAGLIAARRGRRLKI